MSPKFHKDLGVIAWERETLFNSYLLHVFFGIFKKFSTPNYLEFRKFLAITLKGTVNPFHKKISDVPSSLISCPWVLFHNTIKYYKNRTISPFSPIFLRNLKKPNHRMLDLTLAHKMNIRFTKISKSLRRHSVGAWNALSKKMLSQYHLIIIGKKYYFLAVLLIPWIGNYNNFAFSPRIHGFNYSSRVE